MENKISVTVCGANRVELVKALRAFADNLDGSPADSDGSVVQKAKPGKKGKQAAAPEEDFAEETQTEAATQEEFDFEDESNDVEMEVADSSDEEDFTEPPKKEKKAAKKVTIAQVNDACKARAKAGGKDGRTHVLKILKKHFKTESISEIKPEMYGKVIEAMQVTQ